MTIRCQSQADRQCNLELRIDSLQEINYLMNGGILPFVIRKMVHKSTE